MIHVAPFETLLLMAPQKLDSSLCFGEVFGMNIILCRKTSKISKHAEALSLIVNCSFNLTVMIANPPFTHR
jgi:hypothetical protein